MKSTKNHFAVVLDEYGGVLGIVTMNDLLEQLVGDLTDDNSDAEETIPDIVKREDGEDLWEVRGVAPLGDVEKELDVTLPTDKYDTMGGYVFSSYGSVPDDGSEFDIDIDNLHIHVTEIKDHRIARMTVKVDRPEPEDEDEEREKEKNKDKDKDKDE